MKINWFSLGSGKLSRQPAPFAWSLLDPGTSVETWLDVEQASPAELGQFIAPLDLHPLQVAHCLDSDIDPAVLSFANSLLMEY
jgi:hypothetical protein